MVLAVTFYDIVVWIHVSAVVAAFGAVFAYPVLYALLRRASALPAFHAAQVAIWSRLVTPAMVLVLLAGIYLASDADLWSEGWVSATIVILIVLFGIVGMLTGQERRAAELAARGDPGYNAVASRLRIGAALAAVLVLAALFLMVVKPG